MDLMTACNEWIAIVSYSTFALTFPRFWDLVLIVMWSSTIKYVNVYSVSAIRDAIIIRSRILMEYVCSID